jgi:hypothetical protein
MGDRVVSSFFKGEAEWTANPVQTIRYSGVKNGFADPLLTPEASS